MRTDTCDLPGSFSLKYNLIWDKFFGSGLFPQEAATSEFARCRKRRRPTGPLDNRAGDTKSDWQAWNAALAPAREGFMEFTAPPWEGISPHRLPRADDRLIPGHDAGTGLFVQPLEARGACRYGRP